MLNTILEYIVTLLNRILNPMLLIVLAAGTLYCAALGIKFDRTKEPQDRKKAGRALRKGIIGFVLIVLLILALFLLRKPMMEWVNSNGGSIVD